MSNKKTNSTGKFVPGYIQSDITPEAVLEALGGSGKGKSYSLAELQAIFGAGGKRKRGLEAVLATLVAEGKLVRLKGPAYTLPQKLQQVRGYLKVQRQGMGFVRAQGRNAEDVYIHPAQMGAAWDGDLVLAAILPGRSGKNPEGRVLEVLERGRKELMVQMLPQVVKEDGALKRLARPLDARLAGYLLVDAAGLDKTPREGALLFVRVEEAQRNDGAVRAKAVAGFNDASPVAMFERLVKANHNISTSFPAAVLKEAALLPADPLPDKALAAHDGEPQRRDLRALGFVTIDGADAKDFDDAIYVEKTGDGFTLWVAIADVAHYVKPGSELDLEALKRGNSCYFPASVEPMLPEELSNGLCSLKPNLPRLAMVAEMRFNAQGLEQNAAFYPALIQSKARLTYEAVQAALDEAAGKRDLQAAQTDKTPESDVSLARAGLAMLLEAQRLAETLVQRREQRGALSFDLPEARAFLDRHGNITALKTRERLFSHRLIEEFMIAANEAVARRLAGFGNLYFLYRTHAAPDMDKLKDLIKVLQQNGLAVNVPAAPSPADLQKLLDDAAGTPHEFVVNRLLLRSLMQARYSPLPEGHFGLASEAYAHFTSPIRRYADLTVHRALRHTLGFAGKIPGLASLQQIAEDINERERDAVEAEREIFKICAAVFLQNRIGERFGGVVAGLSSFGLFVELEEPPAEGFVPVTSLPDDYYELKHEQQMLLGKRTGIIFRMGQSLDIVLAAADPLRQEISFELAPGQGFGRGRSAVRGKNSKEVAGGKKSPATKRKRQKLPKGSVRARKK